MAKKIRVWDGSAWQDVAPSLPYTAIHSAQASMPLTGVDGQVWLDTDGTLAGQDFVPLTGGTMTGNLNVPSINSGPIVGRNKVLNGDFSIWQRGTSFSLSTGVNTYTADRWFWVMPSGTTVSRQAFSPGSAPTSGYEGQYYVNTTITSNAQNYEMGQRIEDVRTFAGQRVTLSFWARSTVGAQPLGYALFQYFGTGGSPSSMVQCTQVTGSGPYTPTSTWQRYSYTFDVPSISGKTLGTNNDHYLLVRPMQFASTTTNTSVDLWGVQLEAGNQATPFHTATPNQQTELAACQRYYYRMNADTVYTVFGLGPAETSSFIIFSVPIPVQMRINPTSLDFSGLSTYSSTGWIAPSLLSLNSGESSRYYPSITANVTGATADKFYRLIANNTTSAYLGFSAEL